MGYCCGTLHNVHFLDIPKGRATVAEPFVDITDGRATVAEPFVDITDGRATVVEPYIMYSF